MNRLIGAIGVMLSLALWVDPRPALAFDPVLQVAPEARITFKVLGSYRGGWFSKETPASPHAYDEVTRRTFLGSVDRRSLEIVDITNPRLPKLIRRVDLTPFGGEPNSIAEHNGVVAVVVKSATDPTKPHFVVFTNPDGVLLTEPLPVERAGRIAFTPNGRWLVVSESGGPQEVGGQIVFPAAAIAVVDLGWVNWRGCRKGPRTCHLRVGADSIHVADFKAYDTPEARADLKLRGVRLYEKVVPAGLSIGQVLDPEALAISPDSRTAYVSLTRNNAIAIVDIKRAEVVDIVAQGFKDHSLPGNGLDASDKDGGIHITNWPLRSFYESDGIAVVERRGQQFIVTANEGDPVDFQAYSEKAPVGMLPLDETAFPDQTIKNNENLGRLKVTTLDGDVDGDGDFDALYLLGSRSFSIRQADGTLVFDSGDDFERITAEAIPASFNCAEDDNDIDTRSDDRGPEPEHLTVGNIDGRTYVFVTFERIGGIIVYDITDPHSPKFQAYLNNRNFSVVPKTAEACGEERGIEVADPDACAAAGDLEAEGVVFIPRNESPIHAPLLVVTHEASDSTTVYQIDRIRRHRPPNHW